MAKSIWKGDISFGLVSIPVALVSVLEKHDLAFHLLYSRDHSRIRYQRVNEETGKEGVAKVILRSKEYLSLVLPHQNALLLYLLHFKEDIREEADIRVPKEPLNAYRVAAREIKMASDLISEMTNPWQPEKYHNDYQETLKKWLDKKTAAALKTENKVSKRVTSQKTPDVGDFIALLKQSMKKKKQNQGKKREGKS